MRSGFPEADLGELPDGLLQHLKLALRRGIDTRFDWDASQFLSMQAMVCPVVAQGGNAPSASSIAVLEIWSNPVKGLSSS